ncbi:MAG: GAF domain-containing protein, partial [Candidatus Fermentibacteria bacterium]
MEAAKIAILGGGEDELNILSEYHRDPGFEILGIYDRDPRAVAMEVAEIIGVPIFTDRSFLKTFEKADYVVVSGKGGPYNSELGMLSHSGVKILNPSEAASSMADSATGNKTEPTEKPPWPRHLEQALQYINRITDRDRLLKWLLEISVRAVEASSGSIMLHSEKTGELYIGYAMGLSQEVISGTRQKVGTGIAGKVAESGEALLVHDLVDDPLYRDGREREAISSSVSAPLAIGNTLVGVLNISTSEGERRLDENDRDTIDLLASKISPILAQHMRIDTEKIRETEFRIRNYIESLFQKEIDFHDKFLFLCRALADILSADTVTIYTATDEGDWLILGGSDQQIQDGGRAPRIHCIKGSLARSYVNREEVMMTEANHDAGLKISGRRDALTSIYIPLEHEDPLGVALFEFSSLDSLESFIKIKDVLRFQLGFFVYTQLRELRQSRKMRSLEDLSGLTPALMGAPVLRDKLKMLPGLISPIISASRGSFHFIGSGIEEATYFGFPEDEKEWSVLRATDEQMLVRALEQGKPECISFLSRDIGAYDSPPPYRSLVIYPFIGTSDFKAYFIGYDRVPGSPLDPSIFGTHELELLSRISEIILPILHDRDVEKREGKAASFDDLLRSNQKILLERVNEEIERAERYHHGFIVTLYKVNGLKEILKSEYNTTLELINELSIGVRKQVRKTDYFSWIEPDIFAVISLESHHRIEFLEQRLLDFIATVLKRRKLFVEDKVCPASSFAVFPGASETSAELITEAKNRF